MDKCDGTSAVIGAILMVAITVILAAVIAAFIFGAAGAAKNIGSEQAAFSPITQSPSVEGSGDTMVVETTTETPTSTQVESITDRISEIMSLFGMVVLAIGGLGVIVAIMALLIRTPTMRPIPSYSPPPYTPPSDSASIPTPANQTTEVEEIDTSHKVRKFKQ